MNNGRPYDPNQPQQSYQPQQPYGSYQQGSYTGFQQPVNPQQSYPYAQPEQSAYQPQPYQSTGYQQTAYQQPQQGYQQSPYQQPQQAYQQQPYQQPQTYQQAPYQQPQAYQQSPYQQPQQAYQQAPYQQPQQQNVQGGYPYQAGGVPYSSPVIQPAAGPVKPPVDVDGITRLVVYLTLPVLVVLFILSMVFSGAVWLKWVFVALSLAEIGVMWVRPLLLQNDMKLTFSCVLAALAVVAAVSALTSAPADNASQQPGVNPPAANPGYSQSQAYGQPSGNDGYNGGYQDQSGMTIPLTPSPSPSPSPTPEDSGLNSEAVKQLLSFFHFWEVNNTDAMLNLCAPSWIRAQQTPMNSLYRIMANRTPTEYNATAISGTDNDVSRTVTMTVSLHRNDGKDPVKYAFKVVMLKENESWYVDPQSLQSNEKAAATTKSAMITQPPTPAPVADANYVLYFNPNGGTRYHIDPNCKSTNVKFLPFAGQFTYGQLGNAPYDALTACNVCGAPLRPGE